MVALFVLNKQFKNQALTNIRQAQETVITELKSDIDIMSMRLSHLIYTNNNEILAYAAEMDTADFGRRYEYEQKLQQAGNLALEPVKDIISVGFYMKDGRKTYIKMISIVRWMKSGRWTGTRKHWKKAIRSALALTIRFLPVICMWEGKGPFDSCFCPCAGCIH